MGIAGLNIVSDRLERLGNFDVFVLEGQRYVYIKGKVYGPYTEIMVLTDNILSASSITESGIITDIITIRGSYYSATEDMRKALKNVSLALQESMNNGLLEKCERGVISQNYLYTITATTPDGRYYDIDAWISILADYYNYHGVWDAQLGTWKINMEGQER